MIITPSSAIFRKKERLRLCIGLHRLGDTEGERDYYYLSCIDITNETNCYALLYLLISFLRNGSSTLQISYEAADL